jgi:hypothetical protein
MRQRRHRARVARSGFALELCALLGRLGLRCGS